MTLTQKYLALTPEQQEKFRTVKTIEELEPFIAESGFELTAEEKVKALEYANTGKLELSDDDVESVAGGKGGDLYQQEARAEGRTYRLPSNPTPVPGFGLYTIKCAHIKLQLIPIFAKIYDIRYFSGNPTPIRVYKDIKCYECGYLANEAWYMMPSITFGAT